MKEHKKVSLYSNSTGEWTDDSRLNYNLLIREKGRRESNISWNHDSFKLNQSTRVKKRDNFLLSVFQTLISKSLFTSSSVCHTL